MGCRRVGVALAFCLCAAAQTVLTVEQLVSFVRSSIRLQHADKQVAGFLSRVKLSERLEDRVIEELQGHGAGPRTLEALQALGQASQSLPAPRPVAMPAASPIPPPSPAEQARIIEEVRENALGYSKRLPDFICTQVTRRYADPTGLEFWQKMDTLTARLSYFEQKEEYKLILVNNQPTDGSYHAVGGTISSGEFGSTLKQLFEKETQARFEWVRWATLRGKRAHVFGYRVAQPNSKYHVLWERTHEAVPGYRGLLYVERDTRMPLRITLEVEDLPAGFPVMAITNVLDYDYGVIGEQQHLLPLRAEVRSRQGKLLTKNEVEFRMYRKFSAEAVITFDTPAPLDDSQTREQPPK